MTAQQLHKVVSFHVYNSGEYGTFHLREGVHKKDPLLADQDRYWAELCIYSSFGCVGDYWSNIGGHATWFLSKVDRDYIMGKLFGAKAQVFDFDATIRELKLTLFRQMRRGNFEHNEYDPRHLYDEIDSMPHCINEEEFYRTYMDSLNPRTDEHELSDWLGPGDVPIMKTINPQAKGLWEKLWPDFIKALQEHYDKMHPVCRECGAPMPVYMGGLQTHRAGCGQIPF